MSTHDYARVERAIRCVQAHRADQPSLDEVARHVALSPYHFERLFQRWAGTTPKRFLQYLTLDHAKRRLAGYDGAAPSVLDAAWAAGLSGGGRLHDLFVTGDAVTPGEFKRGGAGLRIGYGTHETPFGPAFLGVTARGVCALHFPDEAEDEAALLAWEAARAEPVDEPLAA